MTGERSIQEMTLWFRKEADGEMRLRQLLEDGWIGCMRNDGPIWKIRVVRPPSQESSANNPASPNA